jgi:hypothetical protein
MDRVLAIGRLDQLEKRSFRLDSDFLHGTERLRREQGIAAPKERANSGALGKEAFDEGGLPDARLAINEHDAAAGCFGLAQSIRESLEICLPFQELAGVCSIADRGRTVARHDPDGRRGPRGEGGRVHESGVTDCPNGLH